MYASPPTTDFGDAKTLLEPDETGQGNWVGAPCVHRHDNTTYLAVRERDPEQRGHAITIHEYNPGRDLEPILEITASDLDVVSIERPALVTHPRTGDLQLYLPVDRGGNDWTIRKLADAQTIDEFDPETSRDVLRPRPGTSDGSSVKDPYILTVGGRYYMFYSGSDGTSEQAHLATSVDGETWMRTDENPVLPRAYWHDHHTRISTVIPAPYAPAWLVFYDGSGIADTGRTWNLRTGVGISPDLERFVDTSPDGPLYSAPTADAETGVSTFAACRYLDILPQEDQWELFAEVARPDESFELRHTTVKAPGSDD